MSKRVTTEDRESAIQQLRKLLPPGSTVHTVLRHVGRSGMNRAIDAYLIRDGRTTRLSRRISDATGLIFSDKHEAVMMGGCGTDMGLSLVYELSARLYPDGFGCIGEACHSNDHYNGDKDYTPHRSDEDRKGADGTMCECCRDHWHHSGGFALRQRWI